MTELLGARDGSVYVATEEGISRFREGNWKKVFPVEGPISWFSESLRETQDGAIWASTPWGALKMEEKRFALYTTRVMAGWIRTFAPDVQMVEVPDRVAQVENWGSGIGIRTWYGIVCAVAPGEPGDRAGLKPGDRILTSGGQPYRGGLNGPPDTPVTLIVQRVNRSEPFEVTLMRKKVAGTFHTFPISDILEDRDGNMWFGLDFGGLVRGSNLKTDPTWRLYDAGDSVAVGEEWRLAQAHDGIIWAVTWTNDKGVNRFDGKAWSHFNFGDRAGPDHHPDILVARDGTVWLPGPVLYAFRNGEWTKSKPDGLPISRDMRLLEAADGALWVVSGGQSASRLALNKDQWQTYERLNFQAESSDGVQWFLVVDEQTEDTGIVCRRRNAWTRYGVEDGLMDMPYRVFLSRQGAVWATGSHRNTAATAQFDGRQWSRHIHSELAIQIHPRAIIEDREGALWFGGGPMDFSRNQVGGVLRFDGQNWTHFTPQTGVLGRIYSLAQTGDGHIWACSNWGLSRFDGQSWTMIEEPKALTKLSVDFLYTTQNGALWVGHWL